MAITVDLTQLSGYDSLAAGTYTITAVAKGNGNTYTSSDKSQGSVYEKPASGFTATIVNTLEDIQTSGGDLYFKANTPPTSNDDYDYYIHGGIANCYLYSRGDVYVKGMGNSDRDTGTFTMSDVSKLYIWTDDIAYYPTITSTYPSIISASITVNVRYDSAIELTLNANTVIYTKKKFNAD